MRKFLILAAVLCIAMTACQPDIPMVSSGLNDSYSIARMQALRLCPEFLGEQYLWTMPDAHGNDSIVATTRDYTFISVHPGIYRLRLSIVDDTNPFVHDMVIAVWDEEVAYSRYISRVYEYCPAPGQYVGEIPRYEEGDTQETMRAKAEEYIRGTNDDLISLGGFGGYVTFGFDHSVVNVPDSADFKILGNAFYASSELNPVNPNSGGSAEPGIVMVSIDINGNGVPDDEWYELAGSEYRGTMTQHNYTITYYRTPLNHEATPRPGTGVTDSTYIAWSDNLGGNGYIERNTFHTQEYYPQWVEVDQITFSGTRLPNNAEDVMGDASLYLLHAYEWGYADNHPNNSDKSCFDIEWAVDSAGNNVSLPYIDFVRVYTGVNQQCGRIGEISTEICRAEDLHVAPI